MTELTNQSVGDGQAARFAWTRRHVLALAVLCLAALLDTIDVTVVNVAMPAMLPTKVRVASSSGS